MRGTWSYPKAARLRRRHEFLTVQGHGRRAHTDHFVAIRHPAPGPLARLGVTVSRRVGNAAARNRVRRLVREVFRHRRADMSPPADLVIIAKSGADTLTYAQAASELVRAFGLGPAR